MQAALNIGASKEAIREAREAVLAIIKASCGDQVKLAALEAFTSVTSVNGATITNCNFTTK